MADRIEDSLDNLSGMRNISPVNKEKDEKDRSIMHSLRQKFITALSKLQSSETREIVSACLCRPSTRSGRPSTRIGSLNISACTCPL